jgi:predicted rRNA methylase YqxC with S4 and FtsJ domains
MRISIIDLLKKFLNNKEPTKLINIVNGLYSLGLPQGPSSYMSVYSALRENEALFEKVKPGFYKMRDKKESTKILKSKLNGEELVDLISNYLNKNSTKTPAQVWRYIQNTGIYVSYKTVHRCLQDISFSKKLRIVNEKSFKNTYSNDD